MKIHYFFIRSNDAKILSSLCFTEVSYDLTNMTITLYNLKIYINNSQILISPQRLFALGGTHFELNVCKLLYEILIFFIFLRVQKFVFLRKIILFLSLSTRKLKLFKKMNSLIQSIFSQPNFFCQIL